MSSKPVPICLWKNKIETWSTPLNQNKLRNMIKIKGEIPHISKQTQIQAVGDLTREAAIDRSKMKTVSREKHVDWLMNGWGEVEDPRIAFNNKAYKLWEKQLNVVGPIDHEKKKEQKTKYVNSGSSKIDQALRVLKHPSSHNEYLFFIKIFLADQLWVSSVINSSLIIRTLSQLQPLIKTGREVLFYWTETKRFSLQLRTPEDFPKPRNSQAPLKEWSPIQCSLTQERVTV
jgi:hypothetical protein